MYARVNLKMKKPRLCCCVTWILVNNCISVNKETWYNWFSGKVGDEGFLKMGGGFPSNGQMILKWDGWYPFTLKNRIIDHLEKCGLFLISSMVLGPPIQLQIFWQLNLIKLLGLLTRFGMLVFLGNLGLTKFQVRYLN